jgi:hypothetical protein
MNYFTIGPINTKEKYSEVITFLKAKGFLENGKMLKSKRPKYIFIGMCSYIPEYLPSREPYPVVKLLNGSIETSFKLPQSKYHISRQLS